MHWQKWSDIKLYNYKLEWLWLAYKYSSIYNVISKMKHHYKWKLWNEKYEHYYYPINKATQTKTWIEDVCPRFTKCILKT